MMNGGTSASRVTLQHHILNHQRQHPEATGELSTVLMQLAYAAKIFSHTLAGAALSGQLGPTGATNVQGEATKKLDVFGNRTIADAFARNELVAAIISEEDETPKQLACGAQAKYILAIDPLDGSSNSDINGTVGTIFGVYRPSPSGDTASVTDLRSGRDQVAAGYVMYGPSTIIVYTAGNGVHGFTLDRDIGEFLLTHPDMRCPDDGPYFSANLSRVTEWPDAARAYLDELTSADRSALRYTGALVADVHRSILEGGVYLYPADQRHPDGKLRLLYECAPLSFVVEQAGGAGSTGLAAVLDEPITSIHQRTPLVIGSRRKVQRFEHYAHR